jgi:hypothetical protein
MMRRAADDRAVTERLASFMQPAGMLPERQP